MAKSEQKIRIVIKSYDHHLVDDSSRNIIDAVERVGGGLVSGPIPLPTRTKKFSVLKSTNCNKNAFEQFEMRTHKRIIDISEVSGNLVSTLQQLQMPSGVNIELKMI
jgi:small subunit ribosomal protein S10